MAKPKTKGLGRGLGALISDPGESGAAGAPLDVRVDAISPNPLQPRKTIRDKDLKALTQSVKDKGVLEPLVVRLSGNGRYELIAGERRLRAATAAGLTRVPVIIKEATEAEMLEMALIENLHREDLNPIEEAESYQMLADRFDHTQETIARLSGKDRSTVANLLRLLNLPEPVQDDVRQGRLSTGHARALLPLGDESKILAARKQILTRELTVRQTEALVKQALKGSPPRRTSSASDSDKAYYQSLSEQMTRRVGSKVQVLPRGKKGKVEIRYSSHEELARIMDLLGVKPV
jgi:ParB family chromosome partitioning protein